MRVSVRSIMVAGLLGITACGGTDPVPPPPARPQLWRATDLSGNTLPATAYVFPNEPAVPNVTFYQLDSARIEVDTLGRYVHRTWFSEWRSVDPANGVPYTRILAGSEFDRGSVTVAGTSVVLTSEFIQNHIVRGSRSASDRMRLDHGLVTGDSLLNIGYTLQP